MDAVIKGTDVEKDLETLEDILQSAIRSNIPELSRMSGHKLFSGGHRIRAALAITVHKACGGRNTTQVIPLAASLELMATAVLIHDDIIEKATSAKGAPSVHMMFGRNRAIVTADFLFSRAYGLCTPCGQEVLDIVTGLGASVAEGELLQINLPMRGVTIENYTETISKTTAEVFAVNTKLAARYAAAPTALQESMEVLGHHLGLAYQMVDDYLDMSGGISSCRPKGSMITIGRPTLPAIFARDELNDKARRELISIYKKKARNKKDVNRVIKLVASTEGLERTKAKAEELVMSSMKMIDKLDTSPYKGMLKGLAKFIVERCD